MQELKKLARTHLVRPLSNLVRPKQIDGRKRGSLLEVYDGVEVGRFLVRGRPLEAWVEARQLPAEQWY